MTPARFILVVIFTLALGVVSTPDVLAAPVILLNAAGVLKRTYLYSPSAKILELDPLIIAEDVRKAKSQYDTALTATLQHTQDKSERSSVIFGTESNTTDFNVSVDQLSPTGTQVGLDFINSRQTSDSAFVTSSILFDSISQLRLRQPLLRNSFGYGTRRNVALADSNLSAAQHISRQQLQELSYANLNLYWAWYWNRNVIDITREAHAASRGLLDANREKLSIGLIESPDLSAFAANLNIRQADLLLTEAQLSQTENNLKAALDLNHAKITPGDETTTLQSLPPLKTLIASALAKHPRLLAVRQNLATRNIQVAVQKNALLPQVDLIASLALNGIDPTYGNAVGDIADINPLWSAGLAVSFPLQNRSARAALRQAELTRTQLLYRLQDEENRVIAELRQAYDTLQKNRQRRDVLARAVHNQLQKWQGEIRRYDQGRSDPDLVIRYQNDYLDTLKLALRARIDLQMTALDLQFARGLLAPELYGH